MQTAAATTEQTSLEQFAAHVMAACQGLPAFRFFGGKVLLYHVWCAATVTMSLEDFKAKALEANRRQLLSLSRCDMPQLFDAQDIRDSEVKSYGAEFHFLTVRAIY